MSAFDLALPRKVLFGPGRAGELADLLPTLGSRVVLCTGSDPSRHRHLLGDVEPVAVVRVTREPLVSSDFIGDPRSAVVDLSLLQERGKLVRVVAWYDNEWGYASRLADLLEILALHPGILQ